MLDEHFRIVGRTKFYEPIEEMWVDLDEFLAFYNAERPHQGRNMNGRTPLEVFVAGIRIQPEENPLQAG
jgi:hypothetical protein